jgi:hypothetical protein
MRAEENDLESLDFIPLSKVPKLLPKRRRGRPLHVATAWRWCVNGVDGIKLHSVLIGSQRVTRRDWLEEFFEALAAAKRGEAPAATIRTTARRKRDQRCARERLEAAGI